jgi:uncharacterized membrane protein
MFELAGILLAIGSGLLLLAMVVRYFLVTIAARKYAGLKAHAEYLSIVAKDIVAYYAMKFSNAHWSIWIDRAIEKLMEITGDNREIAQRVIRANIYRTTKQPKHFEGGDTVAQQN